MSAKPGQPSLQTLLDAIAATMRYAAGLAFYTDEELARDLYEQADLVLNADDDWISACCPVCSEVVCDGGCPLEEWRS